ncbi:MAG: DinB family protein [Anaerolineales bacterium]|nr:DinB family protein [Anaerolineales bacterium]
MSAAAQQLAESLEAEGRKTLEFFNELAPEDWAAQVYRDGPGWRVHDLLAHFVEVEGSMLRLIRRISEGGEGVAADFSIDQWNAEHTAALSGWERAALLAEFAERRAATAAFAGGLSAGQLAQRGRHPALGDAEVAQMLRLMYLHLQGHQRDIRRALKAAGQPE